MNSHTRTFALFVLSAVPSLAQMPYSLVDPHIGTAHEGQTTPAVGEPYAMTNFIPETRSTEKKCIAPYYFADMKLTGFRASHWMSGSCTQDYGSVTLMPTTGDVHAEPDARAAAMQTPNVISRPLVHRSAPATVNKPDHIVISLALSVSMSRPATNRSSRLPRRNHASNRNGRRWRGCRSPETDSGMTAGNSKSVNRPRGSARSQLQLPSRRPNHQKRPHVFLR